MAVTSLALTLLAQTQPLRDRLTTLTVQSGSGLISQRFGDIALNARRSIDLSAEIAHRSAYGTVITRVSSNAAVAQNALTQLGSIAQNFLSTATGMIPGDPTALAAISDNAKQALVQVASLLNTQSDGDYVFGGTDTANPPVPVGSGIASSSLVTQIQAQVATLDDSNADAVLAATKSLAESDDPGTSIFSAGLPDLSSGSAPRSTITVGDGQSISYGLFASRNTSAISSGDDSTGSWSRDLLRGLATLAAFTPSQLSSGDGYSSVIQSVQNSFRSAVAAIGIEAGDLGQTQSQLTTLQSAHDTMTTTLKTQLSDVTEVDMATTLTALQSTQTQLEASYQAIARVSDLTLSNYLK